jgi:hypothetical protein
MYFVVGEDDGCGGIIKVGARLVHLATSGQLRQGVIGWNFLMPMPNGKVGFVGRNCSVIGCRVSFAHSHT